MRQSLRTIGLGFVSASVLTCGLAAQEVPVGGKGVNSSTIDPDGTAHVTRVVPVPKTISAEAQRMLARPASDKVVPHTLAARRAGTDTWQSGAGEAFRAIYPVDVQAKTIAGVPVRVITPPSVPPASA